VQKNKLHKKKYKRLAVYFNFTAE